MVKKSTMFERPLVNLENEAVMIAWYEKAGYKARRLTKEALAKNGTLISKHHLEIEPII